MYSNYLLNTYLEPCTTVVFIYFILRFDTEMYVQDIKPVSSSDDNGCPHLPTMVFYYDKYILCQ